MLSRSDLIQIKLVPETHLISKSGKPSQSGSLRLGNPRKGLPVPRGLGGPSIVKPYIQPCRTYGLGVYVSGEGRRIACN